MTNNAIASTQKIREGDAFLFDNSGATRNIEILAKQKAQEAAREQQAKQQKDKQDYDNSNQRTYTFVFRLVLHILPSPCNLLQRLFL